MPRERELRNAAVVAVGVAIAATALVVRYDLEPELLAVTYAMTVVPAILCLSTIYRHRKHPNQRSAFKPGLLALATLLLATAVVLLSLGYLGLLIDFLLVPIAMMVLLLAWVQPRDEDYVGTVVLGLALAPLMTWFLGRADEFLNEGLIAGAAILLIAAALTARRQRGQLANR